MAKSPGKIVRTTASINANAFAAKARRRIEKADLPIDQKLRAAAKLRDVTRELRHNSRLVKKGSVKKD